MGLEGRNLTKNEDAKWQQKFRFGEYFLLWNAESLFVLRFVLILYKEF
jgi:hypothetical protein